VTSFPARIYRSIHVAIRSLAWRDPAVYVAIRLPGTTVSPFMARNVSSLRGLSRHRWFELLAGKQLRSMDVAIPLAGKEYRDTLQRCMAQGTAREVAMAIDSYTLKELQALTGVPTRTLRDWVQRKLLPRPTGKGRGSRYGSSHVLRAKYLRLLTSQGLSPRQARAKLVQSSEDQMAARLASPQGPSGPSTEPLPPPAPNYPSTQWESINVMNGMVILLDLSKGPGLRRVANEIYSHYAIAGSMSL
jgi:DNA-binding transcriptional MerR regulator